MVLLQIRFIFVLLDKERETAQPVFIEMYCSLLILVGIMELIKSFFSILICI